MAATRLLRLAYPAKKPENEGSTRIRALSAMPTSGEASFLSFFFCAVLSSYRVDHFLQLFTDFKERHSLRGNVDDLARFRVTALIASVATIHEGAKASDLDPIILLQSVRHHVENQIDHHLGLLVLKMGLLRDDIDEICLGHGRQCSLIPNATDNLMLLQAFSFQT